MNEIKEEIKKNLKENIHPRKFLKEFRDFAVKGNVIDLAVAVVIGAAFGKIVSSLVADIIMPVAGVIFGGENFSSWKWTLKDAVINSKEVVVKQAVTINIGSFIQNIFDFIIIALAIFLMVKILNRLKKNIIKDEEAGKSVPAPLTKDQELLVEIRDALKK